MQPSIRYGQEPSSYDAVGSKAGLRESAHPPMMQLVRLGVRVRVRVRVGTRVRVSPKP
jgi:hypothetical protein